jgi:hypothetical protein
MLHLIELILMSGSFAAHLHAADAFDQNPDQARTSGRFSGMNDLSTSAISRR